MTFLPFVFSLQSFPQIPLYSFKFIASFSNFYCMNICSCLQIYIPKYDLFNPYHVTFMYIFRDYICHWTTNQYVLSQGRCLAPSFPELPIVLCVQLRFPQAIPCQLCHDHQSCYCSVPVWAVIDESLCIQFLLLLGQRASQQNSQSSGSYCQ